MSKLKVAVLRGGPSSEYEVSLKTGTAILNNLDADKYLAVDVLIDKQGVWHERGLPKKPHIILSTKDVVFNAMHGGYGEDGTVQKILDIFRVPYTGSGVSASALCMNKLLTKKALQPYVKELRVKFARHAVLLPGFGFEERVEEIMNVLQKPFVVKPLSGGSSVGVSIVEDYESLLSAVEKSFEHSPKVLIEEYIKGKEATCAVVEQFRGEDVYPLLPIEIVPHSGRDFFDYEAKYAGASDEICPGNFSSEEKRNIERLARKVHQILGLRHYSRTDFIIAEDGIYFLEVNTLPGLTEESLVPKALSAVGCTFPDFLDHVITIASR